MDWQFFLNNPSVRLRRLPDGKSRLESCKGKSDAVRFPMWKHNIHVDLHEFDSNLYYSTEKQRGKEKEVEEASWGWQFKEKKKRKMEKDERRNK